MFQPVIPTSGLAGWNFLQRTYDTQIQTFSESPLQSRSVDYFRENIGEVASASDLVSDRRLLEVALGAFGLQDDIDNRYFVQKMLEEGTSSPDALANRFSDRRYSDFAEAFGFGPGETSRVGDADLSDEIVGAYLADATSGPNGPEPVHFREAFRTRGPSNYAHGKQEGQSAAPE